jgi:hypothetical protein
VRREGIIFLSGGAKKKEAPYSYLFTWRMKLILQLTATPQMQTQLSRLRGQGITSVTETENSLVVFNMLLTTTVAILE